MEKYSLLVEKADVVSISGSLPRGLDGRAYQKMVTTAEQAGKKVILDTSGELLRVGMEAGPSMVKPNIDEIRMLTGNPCDTMEELAAAAKEIHRAGVEVAVISLGGDGSLVACEEGVYQALVPKIHAVNTVGCGDSMVAGFALGFERGLSIEETHKLASAISAAAALREETGYFVKEDMEEIASRIQIHKIG